MLTLVERAWEPCSWVLLATAGVVGLVALVSPKTFQHVAEIGFLWVDSSKVLARLDKPTHLDRLVLPHSRLLGASVLAAVAILCLRLAVR
jgi:hypothetical protein